MSQFPPTGPGGFSPAPPDPYGAPVASGQPMPPGTVKNWLVESIIAFLCCEGILAIPAIIFAAQVNGKLAVGDYQGAVEASNNAKKWLIIGLVASVCLVGCCGGGSVVLQFAAQR